MSEEATSLTFAELGLPDTLLQTLTSVGYESPSPIQALTIPHLLAGRDVLGQAQTGTGKTAAFALPILAHIDLNLARPQALVLAPTRELAIQVAEAFQRYAQKLPNFHVLPIYGGQGYGPQLHGLQRGTHVVVGTPGRIKDHLARGTLDLSQLKVVVLDEADEMLRMGFIDDVESILQKTPSTRQVALFSATMPPPIRRIAQAHLKDPAEVTIRSSTTTVATVRQRYWLVSGVHKLDALTRILEAEPFEAMIVFARTKIGTEELAERLQARGFAAAAINGDLLQAQREKTIARLKEGQLDILVATDVAARGLDVERISHVLNYDIPYDSEAYVHRIGRTGRAGRSGDAILFVTPRERHLLHAIERATRQPIEPMLLPSVQAVNDRRIARFQKRISEGLELGDLDLLLQGKTPLLLPASGDTAPAGGELPFRHEPPQRGRSDRPERARTERPRRESDRPERTPFVRPEQAPLDRPQRADRAPRPAFERSAPPADALPGAGGESRPPRPVRERPVRPASGEAPPKLEKYRVEVGNRHGMKPGNLVGAVANEAGLESQFIGRIEIEDDHSFIELPEGMPKEVFQHLKKVWVVGRQLQITRVDGESSDAGPARRGPRPTGDAPPRRKKP